MFAERSVKVQAPLDHAKIRFQLLLVSVSFHGPERSGSVKD